jgi:acyl-CoA thioester hydrolase
MSDLFTKTFHVRWGDLDSNAHMANTAYLDLCVDVRMMYFASKGFSLREFERLRFGPVVQKDEIEYFRELRLLEPVTVSFALVGMSDDGSRFRIRNEFFREDGKPAARVTSLGGWLSLDTRKLIAPPAELREILAGLTRTEDFQTMESSLRG